jgi:glycosyltransferase involved in cell wall biosynthesis
MSSLRDHRPVDPSLATDARVAVIIPSHNDAELAREAVTSALAEPDVEVVLVDDGSTDPASLLELAELEGDGVRVLRQPNRGPGPARLAGAQATTAPLLFPLDADDTLQPGSLPALVDSLRHNPNAAFAWGDYEEFGDKHERYRAPRTFLPWSTTYLNLYSPAILIRREVLLAVGGWPPIRYEDWGLLLALVEHGLSGVYVEHVTFQRRLAGGRRLSSGRREHALAYDELRRYYPRAFAERGRLARIERPAAWKRALYPLVYGRRAMIHHRLEGRLRASRLWTHLRPLRR